MTGLKEFRCKKCDRLLGKVEGSVEIACPRCGGINFLDSKTSEIIYKPRLVKQSERKTSSGKRFE